MEGMKFFTSESCKSTVTAVELLNSGSVNL